MSCPPSYEDTDRSQHAILASHRSPVPGDAARRCNEFRFRQIACAPKNRRSKRPRRTGSASRAVTCNGDRHFHDHVSTTRTSRDLDATSHIKRLQCLTDRTYTHKKAAPVPPLATDDRPASVPSAVNRLIGTTGPSRFYFHRLISITSPRTSLNCAQDLCCARGVSIIRASTGS
jgi:hypothetical protein